MNGRSAGSSRGKQNVPTIHGRSVTDPTRDSVLGEDFGSQTGMADARHIVVEHPLDSAFGNR